MNAESEGEKMYLDKWRVAIRNLKNSLFSYPNTAQSCFPDPITDDTVFYCVQGLVYGSQKFPDGKFIRSSPVTSVYSEDGKLFAKTINNIYELKTPSDYFDCDIAENAAQKTGSSELAETAKMHSLINFSRSARGFAIMNRLTLQMSYLKILLLYAITALTHMETRCSTKKKIWLCLFLHM